MLRQVYILLFLILLPAPFLAQTIVIDKHKIEAGRTRPDSNYVKYLIETASGYADNIAKNDSAETLFTEAIAVAGKLDYTNGLLLSRLNLAQYYFVKGKLSQSLNYLMKNEATAIEVGDSASLFNSLRLVATIYMKIGDINMLRATLIRRQRILDRNGIEGLKDTSYYVLSQYNSLALYYSIPQINKQDSAEYFFKKLSRLGQNTAASNLWIQLSNGGLGKIFSFKSMYDSAAYFYKIAATAALKGNRFDNYYSFLVALGDVYKQSGQSDSAFKYANQVYEAANRYSFVSLQASSSGLLAALYQQKRRYDSAVKYMALESRYKDSLSGQETIKSIQVLTSEQQLKEIEKQREKEAAVSAYKATLTNYLFIGGLILLLLIIGFMYRVNKQRAESKKEIEAAYNNLKSTQAQLIQSEKMASLGELTAGIAHEIQNPLNFVNNFSEVNNELVEEIKTENNIEEIKAIANDIKRNNEKILFHGKRADAIVKGMLQHSRQTKGVKVPTGINALCDEYLRLSYHGLRAKDKRFIADFKTAFDENIDKINIVPQDIGRVLLNLFNNAFYAVNEKKKTADENYKPLVTVSTKNITRLEKGCVEVIVADNGNGIPLNIIAKIFQPFFTTKPTGQGTGLGLSLSYDIIKAHGGELKAETNEGKGTEFIITLPL